MDIPKFKALTIIYPNIVNPILTGAKVCSPKSILRDGEDRFENTCIAVWDNGAMCSVITELTAQKLNLMPIDGTFVSGLGGTQYKNKYIFDITLPNGVEIFDLAVIELGNPTDQEGNKLDTFGLLIGMGIIGRGDFIITNSEGKQSCRSGSRHAIKLIMLMDIIKAGAKQKNVNTLIRIMPILLVLTLPNYFTAWIYPLVKKFISHPIFIWAYPTMPRA